jgi:DNA-binding response OmpR family regulator
MDFSLPDGCGIEFCKEIRYLTDAVFFFYFPKNITGGEQKAIEAGAEDFMDKSEPLGRQVMRVKFLMERINDMENRGMQHGQPI